MNIEHLLLRKSKKKQEKHKAVDKKKITTDEITKEHELINIEKEEKKIKLVAEMIADIILEKLKEGADEKRQYLKIQPQKDKAIEPLIILLMKID